MDEQNCQRVYIEYNIFKIIRVLNPEEVVSIYLRASQLPQSIYWTKNKTKFKSSSEAKETAAGDLSFKI